MQNRCVKAREPHVLHHHDPQRIVWVSKALGDLLKLRLRAPEMGDLRLIGRLRGDHTGDGLLAQALCKQAGQLGGDPSRIRHNHRLARLGLTTREEVGVDVLGKPIEALGGSYHLLELRPRRDQFARGLLLLLFEHLLHLGKLPLIGDIERDRTRLVVDRDGRVVILGLTHPVDRDVIAEDHPSGAVCTFNRRAGESDARRVRQRKCDVLSKRRVL
jgi:hypothetical protein